MLNYVLSRCRGITHSCPGNGCCGITGGVRHGCGIILVVWPGVCYGIKGGGIPDSVYWISPINKFSLITSLFLIEAFLVLVDFMSMEEKHEKTPRSF